MSKTLNSSNSRWGAGSGLTFPVNGEKNWDVWVETAIQALLDHDHSTNSKGEEISNAAIAADTITADKLLFNNNTYLRWKNSSAVATDVIKLNASDQVEVDPDIAKLILVNNTALQSDDVGGTARNLIHIDASDAVEISDANVGQIIRLQKETLADNTSSATDVPDFAVLGTDESAFIFYSIDRGNDNQMGQLWIDEDNSNIIEECAGDDVGVTFSVVTGQLKYTTTSTGNAATIKMTVIRG